MLRYSTIITDIVDSVATVRLMRPQVHNAMDEQMMRELSSCFIDLSSDDAVRSIVLTGEGTSFCAGADLNWMKSMVGYSKEQNEEDSRLLLQMYDSISKCHKPVIGRINGSAFGGGIGLIAVCDIAIGKKDSQFCFSEANLGIIPSVISTFIGRRLSLATMRRFFITAERFDGQCARQIGLIDILVDTAEELDEKTSFYLKLLKRSGPQAIQEVKRLLDEYQELEEERYREQSVKTIARLRVSKEGQEGINAFLEKRKARWNQ